MKCPKCGTENALKYQNIHQYADEYRILKNGAVSKQKKTVYIGSEEWGAVVCENCNAYWNNDDFDIINGRLVFRR